jgi:hypothetical protein
LSARQLGELLRQHDATHLASLAHHEYVDQLERAVDQLHADANTVRRRFVRVDRAK